MRVYLAINNCFAQKRWCKPNEWMRIVEELGLQYVEASSDNEIDPLYSCPGFLEDWRDQAATAEANHAVRIVNCYSGHGTYSTLGLGHPDRRVRHHLVENWVKPMLELAGSLGADMGFLMHAFSEQVLASPEQYERFRTVLIEHLQSISCYAARQGVGALSVEQMYSPNQVPWTLEGAGQFLRRANDKAGGCPVYITIDTGHQSGQRLFTAPTEEQLAGFVDAIRGGRQSSIYLGLDLHYGEFERMVEEGASLPEVQDRLRDFMREYDYLFCGPDDGDPYAWLERYGCYSPIIHLQQTDGTSSDHLPFTHRNNSRGIISAPRVLEALRASTEHPAPGFPPAASHVYLTLQPFLPIACDSRAWLDAIAESVRYWRHFVPEDGLTLDELLGE